MQAPERFWAIVLANTVGNLTNPEIAALRQQLTAASPPRPPVLWHAALGKTFRAEHPVKSFLYAQIAGTNAPLAADFRDQLGRLTTPVERYAATRVPTLFLTSDEDGLIWPELSSMVHQHVPGSRFVRVEAAGHSTYFERPDVFNREVGGVPEGASAMKWCRFQSGRKVAYGIIEETTVTEVTGTPFEALCPDIDDVSAEPGQAARAGDSPHVLCRRRQLP